MILELNLSASAALRSRTERMFGNIQVLVKDEAEDTYSIRWRNRMNLATTTIYKVKKNFMIEIMNGESTQLVRITKDVREGFLGFFLSADFERIDEDSVIAARRFAVEQLKKFESIIEFKVPRSALRILRRRSNRVYITEEAVPEEYAGMPIDQFDGPKVAGSLLFVYPSGDRADVRTAKGVVTVPTDRLWYD